MYILFLAKNIFKSIKKLIRLLGLFPLYIWELHLNKYKGIISALYH